MKEGMGAEIPVHLTSKRELAQKLEETFLK
jgi:hypothetical protein